VDEFLDILENNYERKHVLFMEKEMLNKLKFHLTVPTPFVFLVRFLKAAGSDEEARPYLDSDLYC
jgi:cyclin B